MMVLHCYNILKKHCLVKGHEHVYLFSAKCFVVLTVIVGSLLSLFCTRCEGMVQHPSSVYSYLVAPAPLLKRLLFLPFNCLDTLVKYQSYIIKA